MRLHSKSNLLLTLQKKKFRTDIPEGELLLALMIYSKVVIQYFFTPLFITCFARDNPRFQTFIRGTPLGSIPSSLSDASAFRNPSRRCFSLIG